MLCENKVIPFFHQRNTNKKKSYYDKSYFGSREHRMSVLGGATLRLTRNTFHPRVLNFVARQGKLEFLILLYSIWKRLIKFLNCLLISSTTLSPSKTTHNYIFVLLKRLQRTRPKQSIISHKSNFFYRCSLVTLRLNQKWKTSTRKKWRANDDYINDCSRELLEQDSRITMNFSTIALAFMTTI